jgi:YfiH family protein
MLNPLQSAILSQISFIKHGFFTRQGGISQGIYASLNLSMTKGDQEKNVSENQRRITEWFDKNPLFLMNQVHEDDVLFVTEPFQNKVMPKVDGLITSFPGLILGVTTADCIPLLFADFESRLIGAVHSGWRGTLKNIAGKTIRKMKDYGAKKIYAALGPAIAQSYFEVGDEVYEVFGPAYTRFFSPSASPNRYLCDLKGIVAGQLAQEGIHSIDVLPYDTYSAPELFFSCRRSTHQGQSLFGCQFSGIMITPI